MDANTTIVIVAIIFAVVAIIGFLIYRRNAEVGVELPGSKLKFKGGAGTNRSAQNTKKPKNQSNGIFGNLSIGKTRVELRGKGTIAKNTSIGDTELSKEDENFQVQNHPKPRNKKHN